MAEVVEVSNKERNAYLHTADIYVIHLCINNMDRIATKYLDMNPDYLKDLDEYLREEYKLRGKTYKRETYNCYILRKWASRKENSGKDQMQVSRYKCFFPNKFLFYTSNVN